MTVKKFITTGAQYGDQGPLASNNLERNIQEFVQDLENARPNGIFCTPVDESVPTHLKAGCEIVYPGIQSPHNTFIVLGRDRHASLASGAGGSGHTSSGMIDLVVGKGHITSVRRVKQNSIAGLAQTNMPKKGPGNELKKTDVMGPNFIHDAARIYITQKTHPDEGGIDGYLGLPLTPQIDSGGKSSIAIKSDHTRIVGREVVRIYAGTMRNVEGSLLDSGGESNCLGNPLDKARIELIAGNIGSAATGELSDTDLQPVVLGNHLKMYLSSLKDNLIKGYDSNRDFAKHLGSIFKTLVILCVKNGMLVGAGKAILGLIQSIINYIEQWTASLDTIVDSINQLDEIHFRGATSILSATVFTT